MAVGEDCVLCGWGWGWEGTGVASVLCESVLACRIMTPKLHWHGHWLCLRLPPAGLIRRKQNPQLSNQEMVDLIWLALDASGFPDAVKRMLPQASADW